MKLELCFIASFLPFVSCYSASLLNKATVFGCQIAALKVAFGYVAEDPGKAFWECLCLYDPALVSILSCVLNITSDFNASLELFDHFCKENLGQLPTIDQYMAKLANGSNYLSRPVSYDGPFYSPVYLNSSVVQTHVSSLLTFYYNLDKSTFSGKIISLYWTAVFVLYALARHFLHRFLSVLTVYPKVYQKAVVPFQQYLTFPILWKHHHNPLPLPGPFLSALVPSTLESSIILLYALLNVYLLVFGYSTNPSSSFFDSVFGEMVRYIADRSGIIALDSVPILVILAGRNSLLTCFTGMPYSTLIVYHKWILRGMLFNASIHSALYILISFARGALYHDLKESYYLFGIVATVAAGVLIVQATHTLRSRWYELFLILHIIFASVFLIGMVRHCITVGWMEYTVAAVGLWIFDRIARIARLYFYGVPYARIQIVGPTTLKVVAPLRNIKPYPGCYVFVQFWKAKFFWQSHPFCLIESVCEPGMGVMYIQAKKGITRRLYDFVKSEGGDYKLRVSLEGPYGEAHDLSRYNRAVFLAGGTGIPGPFYYAYKMMQSKQNMKLYWSAKTLAEVQWFEDELRSLFGNQIPVEIYLTREHGYRIEPQNATDGSHEHEENKSDTKSERIPLLKSSVSHDVSHIRNEIEVSSQVFYEQRPNLDKIIQEECELVAGSCSLNKSIAFVFCGPGAMCDEVRDIASQHVGRYECVIDLFEELQVW